MTPVSYECKVSLDSATCLQKLTEAMNNQRNRKNFPPSMVDGVIRADEIHLHKGTQLSSAYTPILSAKIFDSASGALISGAFKIHLFSKIFSWIVLALVFVFSMFSLYFLIQVTDSIDNFSWWTVLILLFPLIICFLVSIAILKCSTITEEKTEYVREFIDNALTEKDRTRRSSQS